MEPVQIIHQEKILSSIEFSKMSFSYDQQVILSNVDLKMTAGSFTGLSGFSGRGKTTLLNLLLGFLDQHSGVISFNDQPTVARDRKSYWPVISYSRQETFVIHDSIQHNITLTDNPDMEKLWSAIHQAGLTNFVADSGKGLDTIIAEQGRNISGGQRQRIMMARALYRDADLYILDEPFNELDREASRELLTRLKTLSEKGKMVLLVTHDPEALQFCSQIILLDER